MQDGGNSLVFLAVAMKDLLVKSTSATELEFAEETVDFLWLDNSNSDNSLIFQEAYRDNKNQHQRLWYYTLRASTKRSEPHRTDFLGRIRYPHLKKKTIDLHANVTVPGPVERQHD